MNYALILSSGENRDWLMQCVRQLSGVGGLDYAALEPSCHSLYIASGKPFQFDSDSESAVEKKEPEGSRVRGTVNSKSYLSKQARITSQTYLKQLVSVF